MGSRQGPAVLHRTGRRAWRVAAAVGVELVEKGPSEPLRRWRASGGIELEYSARVLGRRGPSSRARHGKRFENEGRLLIPRVKGLMGALQKGGVFWMLAWMSGV